MSDPSPELGTLLLEARARAGRDRADYLDRACGDDARLRAEVESLLAFDADTPSLLEGSGLARVLDRAAGATADDRDLSRAGEGQAATAGAEPARVGPYSILQRIGEGGMGVVYRARQEVPIRRDVALKVVRRGLDTDRIVARFEMERRTLARFDHPGVARVLDAGATNDGRPYFVMELVDGQPITAFADAGRLSVRQRVELLAAVCDAVRHAHQRGIIHRDLKPSNILVSLRDGRPEPKVIDFGIAKAVGDGDTEGEAELLTRVGQFIGTPDYMSPEQAGAVDASVDTRTDVYALGVVLYELLAGRRPFTFARVAHDEVQRVLAGTEPDRPSTGLRTRRPRPSTAMAGALPESLAAVAEARSSTVDRLHRDLAGDLDNIVLKAIAREPSARYASVEDLARDLERYLTGMPVEARPASWAYRARKFVARHAAAVGVAAGALVLLTVFVVTTILQARQVAAERDRAVAAERVAEQEAETARRVSAFLTGVFTVADPTQRTGETVTARELLDRGAKEIQQLSGEPAVQASLLQTMGNAYKQLGLYREAVGLLEESVAVRDRHAPGDREARASALKDAGDALRMADRTKDAEPRLRQALADLDAASAGGPAGNPRARRQADFLRGEVLNNLSLAVQSLGRLDEAERLSREALALRRGALDALKEEEAARVPASERTTVEDAVGNSLTNLAGVLIARSRYAEAEPVVRDALALRRQVHGERHPRVASTLHTLGVVLASTNRAAEAEPVLREALEQRRALLGPQHPMAMSTVGEIASLLHDLGRLDEAEALYRERLAYARAQAPGSLEEAISLNNLASLLEERGEFSTALPMFQRSFEIRRTARGPRHPSVATAINNLGRLAWEMGDHERAEALLAEALALREDLLGASHQLTAGARFNLGRAQQAQGALARAEASYRAALEVMAAGTPPSPLAMAGVRVALGGLLVGSGRAAEAEPLLREAVAAREGAMPAGDWRVAEARMVLGLALRAVGDRPRGDALVRANAPVVAAAPGAARPVRAQARAAVALVRPRR